MAINGKEYTGEEKHTIDEPQYWQAILGDICQLPSFPRATGDPQRYVECVKQSLDTGDRLVIFFKLKYYSFLSLKFHT